MIGEKRSVSSVVFKIINYTILTAFFLICLWPFYYIFIYSLSDTAAADRGMSILFRPVGFTLDNYVQVFRLQGMLRSAYISTMRTVIGTTITLFCCAFFGYLVSKESMYFRKFIYRTTLITMYVSGGLIPYVLTMRAYGLTNTFWLYVIPSAILPMYVLLIKTFIEQLPESLEESAELDGAGTLTLFLKIIIPLSKPILAVIVVFSAVAHWNTFMDNFLMVTDEALMTLQLRLRNTIIQADRLARHLATLGLDGDSIITPMTVRMTVTMIVTAPILVVYPIMQRYFIKGIMIGAVKG